MVNIEAPDQLLRYLRDTDRLARGEPSSVRPLAGGVSNRAVLVNWADGSGWVLKQALPKLRVAEDWFCDPARIQREALGLKSVAALLPKDSVPRLLFEDPVHDLLAMEAVPAPHQNWKTS